MPKRGHRYPQVEPGAAALIDTTVAAAPPALRVRQALARALDDHVGALELGGRGWVLRDDLARAAALGLDDLPASAIIRPLPVLTASEPEVAARRALGSGAPLVIVEERRRALGAISAASRPTGTLSLSVAARLTRSLPGWTTEVLAALGRLASARGVRAFLVGGLVRDVLRGITLERADLDVVIEGDGLGFAHALGDELGASVIEHGRFLTASIRQPSGERIDVATARSERYEAAGALPRVMPASMLADLARRDFTVNAMAVELGGPDMRLLDPYGGRGDLARRRLRVLHPLSFVEDPTRILRGARYAVRLGLAYDAWTSACQALALRLGDYPALSGQRVAAELARLLDDTRPEAALRRLGVGGALALLDGRYRFTRAASQRLSALPALWAWTSRHALEATRLDTALVALLADQPVDVVTDVLRRLARAADRLTRAIRCLQRVEALAARLGELPAGAQRARVLRERTDLELAALWLGGGAARAAVEWWVDDARRVRPTLRGDEVVELGVRRGPAVAEVLDQLRDRRLDGEVRDREAEIEYVRHWLGARKEG